MPTTVELPRSIATTVTTAGALAIGKHNPVNASSAALTMTLPAAVTANAGRRISVEKTDASTNAVTISGPIRGATSTVALVWQNESVDLVADATGSWWPVAGHKTKASLDASYSGLEVLNRSALLPFAAALANRDAATCRILAFGDSITEGARSGSWAGHYVNVLAKRLMTAYPCVVGNPVGGSYLPAVQLSVNGPAIPVAHSNSANVGTPAYFGPGFASMFLGGTDTATFTVVGTSANLWFVQAGNARSALVSIDGGAAATVTIPAGAGAAVVDAWLYNVALGAAGTHTIAVSYNSGNLNFAGIDVFNGDETKGVHGIPGGHSGWGAHDYVNQDGLSGSSLSQLAVGANPNLVTIMLGVNDWGKGLRSSAQFGADLVTIVARLRVGAPNTAILLVAPFATSPQGTTLEPYANYVGAMRAVAQADPTVAYLDLSKSMPATTAAGTYGLYYSDQIHPLAPGHTLIADLLFTALRSPVAA
jgi:lysophospholipase L1-like esterase